MATVEEVRARLTADVGQFQAAFIAASKTVDDFAVKLNQFQRGAKGTSGFLTGRLAASEIMAEMAKDANQAAPAIARVTREVQVLASPKTLGGIRLLRGAFSALAFEAVASAGPVGRLVTGFTALAGVGTGALVAILAPLAGIAIGFKRAEAEAKKFFDTLQVDRDRRQRELSAIGNANLSPDQLIDRLQAAKAAFAHLTPDIRYINNVAIFEPAAFSAAKLAEALEGKLGEAAREAAQRVAALQAALDAATASSREAAQEFAAAQRVFLENMQRDLAQIGPPEVKPFLLGPEIDVAMERRGKELAQKVVQGFQGIDEALGQALKQEFRKGLGKGSDEINTQMQMLGQDAVRSLVEGIIEGTDNLFDLLASIFKRFLVGGILDAIFGGAFGVGKAAAAAALPGGTEIPELSPAMVGPPVFNLNLPPARTPFDIARDADWQRAFRETADVAHSQGYRR